MFTFDKINAGIVFSTLMIAEPVFAQAGVESSLTMSLLRAFLALVFVLALFFFLIYIIRRFYPRILQRLPNALQMDEQIELRSVKTLGPKKFIYVVRVGSNSYLLGATDHNIVKIDEWSDTSDQTHAKSSLTSTS
jgi:flagellar biogenesis protein FliO